MIGPGQGILLPAFPIGSHSDGEGRSGPMRRLAVAVTATLAIGVTSGCGEPSLGGPKASVVEDFPVPAGTRLFDHYTPGSIATYVTPAGTTGAQLIAWYERLGVVNRAWHGFSTCSPNPVAYHVSYGPDTHQWMWRTPTGVLLVDVMRVEFGSSSGTRTVVDLSDSPSPTGAVCSYQRAP